MLSRRLLRIKVVKALFAHLKSGADNMMASEKTLMASVDKAYDLYFQILPLPVELPRYAEQRQELESNGKVIVKIERMVFTFTRSFIASGLKNAILNQPDIPITCPVHLIQGLKDTFIDWRVIFRIAAKLRSDKVAIKLLKNSNHHLQHPLDLEEINNSLRSIVEAL